MPKTVQDQMSSLFQKMEELEIQLNAQGKPSIGKLERRMDAFEEHIGVHLAEVEGKVEAFEKADGRSEDIGTRVTALEVDAEQKSRSMVHGASIEVDLETGRQMNITAQALGLRSGEELSQIVLHAFLDMYEEDECSITFPLTLQQVPTA